MDEQKNLPRTAIFVILGFSIGIAIVYGWFAVTFAKEIDYVKLFGPMIYSSNEAALMVKTRNTSNGLINSYEVDSFGNTKGTDRERFEPNSEYKFNLEEHEQNSCDKALKDRINSAALLVRKYEDHDIRTQRAFVKNDVIYISAMYNVNISCPWYLFRYNEADDTVTPLCSFAEQEILDIRI